MVLKDYMIETLINISTQRSDIVKNTLDEVQNIPKINVIVASKSWNIFENYLITKPFTVLLINMGGNFHDNFLEILNILKKYKNYSIVFEVFDSARFTELVEINEMKYYIEYCLINNINIHYYNLGAKKLIM